LSIIYRQQKLFWGQNRLHRRRLELPVGYDRQAKELCSTYKDTRNPYTRRGWVSQPIAVGRGNLGPIRHSTTSGDLKQHLMIIKKRYHVSAKGHDTAYCVNFRHNPTICFESQSENMGYFRGNNPRPLCHLFYA